MRHGITKGFQLLVQRSQVLVGALNACKRVTQRLRHGVKVPGQSRDLIITAPPQTHVQVARRDGMCGLLQLDEGRQRMAVDQPGQTRQDQRQQTQPGGDHLHHPVLRNLDALVGQRSQSKCIGYAVLLVHQQPVDQLRLEALARAGIRKVTFTVDCQFCEEARRGGASGTQVGQDGRVRRLPKMVGCNQRVNAIRHRIPLRTRPFASVLQVVKTHQPQLGVTLQYFGGLAALAGGIGHFRSTPGDGRRDQADGTKSGASGQPVFGSDFHRVACGYRTTVTRSGCTASSASRYRCGNRLGKGLLGVWPRSMAQSA